MNKIQKQRKDLGLAGKALQAEVTDPQKKIDMEAELGVYRMCS